MFKVSIYLKGGQVITDKFEFFEIGTHGGGLSSAKWTKNSGQMLFLRLDDISAILSEEA